MSGISSANHAKDLRVCIDARLVSGQWGGVEQAIIGLASGLSRLTDGEEEYLFLADPNDSDWIRPYLHGPCRVLEWRPPSIQGWRQSIKGLLRSRAPLVETIYRRLSSVPGLRPSGPRWSDGTVERAGVDVMHFTMQNAFLTKLPSVYQPWDLQHLHFPRFFSRREYLTRELTYRAYCERAQLVVAASEWGRRDLLEHYRLQDDKVEVVPTASVLSVYPTPDEEDIAAARQRLALPSAFILYPAQTWMHKNHLGLLEALAILRKERGILVPLLCSGRMNEHYPKVQARARELGISDQVRFVGFVSPLELQCLYRLASFMVFPSLFEGWGLPIAEAFAAGLPVTCSRVTCLPEQVGDAAILFDPTQPEDIADAIYRLWTDAELRHTLAERGNGRSGQFNWERTALIFRAHYRRIASRRLTEEDRNLLERQATTHE